MALVLLASLLALAACAGSASTGTFYMPMDTPGGQLCADQCGAAKSYCQQDCDFRHRQCMGVVQGQALQDYAQYANDQFATHQPPELLPRDFERSAPCDTAKKTCGEACEANYQACYINCGGEVAATPSCQFVCF